MPLPCLHFRLRISIAMRWRVDYARILFDMLTQMFSLGSRPRGVLVNYRCDPDHIFSTIFALIILLLHTFAQGRQHLSFSQHLQVALECRVASFQKFKNPTCFGMADSDYVSSSDRVAPQMLQKG